MNQIKKVVFAAILGLTVAHTPCVKAGTWENLTHYAATTPLEHPIAFTISPPFLAGVLGCETDANFLYGIHNAVLCAVLWGLSRKQSTINPLWAYSITPAAVSILVGVNAYYNGNGLKGEVAKSSKPSIMRGLCMGGITFAAASGAYAFVVGTALGTTYITTSAIDKIRHLIKG